MTTPLVEIRGLTKAYVRGKQRVEVLHGIDLDIPEGDFVALMGPSGSGKTTLLNLIGGLDSPSGGLLRVGGQRIDDFGSDELAAGLAPANQRFGAYAAAAGNVENRLVIDDELLAPHRPLQRSQGRQATAPGAYHQGQ